ANFPGPDNWNDPLQDDDSRGKFIKEIQDDFELRLKEFITTADYCAKSARIYSRLHRRWRWIIIIFTGVVVIMNLVVAYSVNNTPDSSSFGSLALNLSIAAAVAAAILAILANLENFSNPLERAHGFRESRELFVAAQRRAKNRFRTYVLALYPSPIACRNAAIMEAELAEIDRELRTKFKELTAARDTNR
ncbi:MAG: hypothetical protein QF357_07860, partial [Dehalococcoidia bacterium]|nr:hypothetical protein [Dehalococcoidia bacterium]